MKKKELNILINSFTQRKAPLLNLIELSKKRIDKNIKIFLGNNKYFPFFIFYADAFVKVPLCKDYNKRKILNILKKFKINIVIPTSDAELLFWSKHKTFFESNNISVFVSNYSSIKICVDKQKFYNFCKNNNIPSIQILSQKEYSKNNIKLVLKERFSFEKSITIINKSYRQIKNYLLKFKNPIIQKYVPGYEISVDAFMDEKFKVVGVVMRRRDYVVGGESQVTTIFKNKKMEKKFVTYFEALKISGVAMFQAKIYKDKIFIIECNPRIGGATCLSIRNGLDIVYWQIKKILNSKFQYKFRMGKKSQLFRFPVDHYL